MWIKICGITRQKDAEAAVEAGVDAIGLNFYAPSPRSITKSVARVIAERIRGHVDVVGVFVNMPIPNVVEICQHVGLSAVQFHGSETPDNLVQFRQACTGINVIRAIRLANSGNSLATTAAPWQRLQPPPAGLLVDAFVPGEYGGTGQTVNPSLLHNHRDIASRLILAGGLTPDNVTEIAQEVRPWGVDTASGVEHEPGIKSKRSMQQFINCCRAVSESNERERLSEL